MLLLSIFDTSTVEYRQRPLHPLESCWICKQKMQAAASTPTSLACALLPSQGSFGALQSSACRLQWRKQERKCPQKACLSLITCQLELKPPPYSLNSLEPHMSHETLEYHWGKHQRGYVENLNRQIVGTELDDMMLEDIVKLTYNKGNFLPAFNNAAQIWNHEFFWESIKPGGGGKPSGELLELIQRDFGSYEDFLREFTVAASTQFGSGWTWLVYKTNRLNVGNAVNPRSSEEDKKLVIVKSPNAVNPLVWDYSPLLTIDVWEHAYYLDYLNRRGDYISTFLEKLVSWETVSLRLEMAKARAVEREREEERMTREEEKEEMGDSEDVEMHSDSENDDDDDSSDVE